LNLIYSNKIFFIKIFLFQNSKRIFFQFLSQRDEEKIFSLFRELSVERCKKRNLKLPKWPVLLFFHSSMRMISSVVQYNGFLKRLNFYFCVIDFEDFIMTFKKKISLRRVGKYHSQPSTGEFFRFWSTLLEQS